jgi:hypothetical protein
MPRPRAARAARGEVPERVDRQRADHVPVGMMQADAPPPRPMELAAGKVDAPPTVDDEVVVARDTVVRDDAFARKQFRAPMAAAAPPVPAVALSSAGREDLREKSKDAGLAFTVTGIGEKRVLALLTAEEASHKASGDVKRDGNAPDVRARRMRSIERDAVPRSVVPQPVVKRLADGRVSILATIRADDLPRILAALGKEGSVEPAGKRGEAAPGNGPVLIELLLTP